MESETSTSERLRALPPIPPHPAAPHPPPPRSPPPHSRGYRSPTVGCELWAMGSALWGWGCGV